MLSQTAKLFRLSFLSLALAVPSALFAQKMDKPNIDKFTNDTTYYTTTEKIAANKGSLSSSAENLEAYTSYHQGNINFHLQVELTTFDHYRYHANAGNKILLKLTDSSLVTLSNLSDVQSVRQGVGPRITGRECWVATVRGAVSADDIAKICSSGVAAIRVETDKANIDFDIKPKDSEVIKKMFVLILKPK